MKIFGGRLDPVDGLGGAIEYVGAAPVVGQVFGAGRILVGVSLLAVCAVALVVCEIAICRWNKKQMADSSEEGCVDKAKTKWWRSEKKNWQGIGAWSAAHAFLGTLDVTGIATAIVAVQLFANLRCGPRCCRFW